MRLKWDTLGYSIQGTHHHPLNGQRVKTVVSFGTKNKPLVFPNTCTRMVTDMSYRAERPRNARVIWTVLSEVGKMIPLLAFMILMVLTLVWLADWLALIIE